MPGGLGISVGPTESAAAGKPPLFEQLILEAAAAPGWVVAAGMESPRWDVLWGAGVMDDSGVDAGSAHVRPRPPPQPPPPPQCVRIAARL